VIPAWQLALSFAIALSIGAGVGIAVEELRWMRRRGRLTRAAVREMRLSLSSLPPNVVVSIALAGAWLGLYEVVSALTPLHIDTGLLTLLPALLLADFCYYLEHRAAHRWGVLWMMYHAVHHSSPDYTVATAYRVSFVNQLVAPLFYLPCVLAGLEPLLVVGLQVFAIHYQAWVHTRAIGALPILDAVFNKQPFILVIKRFRPVMFFLIFDIIYDHIFFPDRICKRAITFLPTAKQRKFARFFHPDIGSNFYVFYIIGDTKGRMQIRKYMNVIRHPVNPVQLTFFIFNQSPNVFVQIFFIICINCCFTVFGAKYNLIIYLTV